MPVPDRRRPAKGRGLIYFLMIAGIVLVTAASFGQLSMRGSHVASTLQSVQKGTVPLDQARYDLERLQFAHAQDAEEKFDIYWRTWTLDAGIALGGVLLLLSLGRLFKESDERYAV